MKNVVITSILALFLIIGCGESASERDNNDSDNKDMSKIYAHYGEIEAGILLDHLEKCEALGIKKVTVISDNEAKGEIDILTEGTTGEILSKYIIDGVITPKYTGAIETADNKTFRLLNRIFNIPVNLKGLDISNLPLIIVDGVELLIGSARRVEVAKGKLEVKGEVNLVFVRNGSSLVLKDRAAFVKDIIVFDGEVQLLAGNRATNNIRLTKGSVSSEGRDVEKVQIGGGEFSISGGAKVSDAILKGGTFKVLDAQSTVYYRIEGAATIENNSGGTAIELSDD